MREPSDEKPRLPIMYRRQPEFRDDKTLYYHNDRFDPEHAFESRRKKKTGSFFKRNRVTIIVIVDILLLVGGYQLITNVILPSQGRVTDQGMEYSVQARGTESGVLVTTRILFTGDASEYSGAIVTVSVKESGGDRVFSQVNDILPSEKGESRIVQVELLDSLIPDLSQLKEVEAVILVNGKELRLRTGITGAD